jgi:hypothetical protein
MVWHKVEGKSSEVAPLPLHQLFGGSEHLICHQLIFLTRVCEQVDLIFFLGHKIVGKENLLAISCSPPRYGLA